MAAPRHLVGMVEAHAVQDAGAAVMAGGIEAREAERGHHLDLVLRHGAERIAAVVLAARRLLGIAIAAQIRAHDGEFSARRGAILCQDTWVNGIAVHEQERRPASAIDRHDACAAGLDLGAGESLEHWRCPPVSLLAGQNDIPFVRPLTLPLIASSWFDPPRCLRPFGSGRIRSHHKNPREGS